MKIGILLLVATTILAGIALTACKTSNTQAGDSSKLPASCTLVAMSPAGRLEHQRRLENLSRAALLKNKTAEGFVLIVNLRQMSFADLQLWMENEQKCCSFLKMTSRMTEANVSAEVTVDCPKELRAQVIETFGIHIRQ